MNFQNRIEKLDYEKMNGSHLTKVVTMEASSSLTPWSKTSFIKEMLNPLAYCFISKGVGLLNSPLVGYICFRNIAEESELLNICVHPHYRQLGIGKNMMQFYIDLCSHMKIKTFYLEVNSLNQAALHLYQCFSYQPFGKRKNFYQGQFDALLMVKRMD